VLATCNSIVFAQAKTGAGLIKGMNKSIEVIVGDITKVKADAIVNAANTSLMGGGGVDGAIHRAGGPVILEECRNIVAKQGGCATGEAVITTAGNLPAKYVIHTVGPVWQDGKHHEAEKLAACYTNSLKLAMQHDCKTIAFPNISTGVYGYPKSEAAKVSMKAITEFLRGNSKIEKILLVCFDEENAELVREQIEK
jgi:O-acetyl-ADP-ribose deacetylase (regulator of RNase III)